MRDTKRKWRVSWMLAFLGCIGCYKKDRVLSPSPSSIPVVINKVTSNSVSLPTLIIDSPYGREKVSPAVWNQKTLSFSEGMPQTITVKPGDTLYKLSRRYGVPIPNIIEKNDLPSPYLLKTGQKLVLLSPRIHVVSQGEDVYQISALHHVSPNRLVVQNKLENKPDLIEGQILVLPAVKKAVAPLKSEPVAAYVSPSVEKKKKSRRLEKDITKVSLPPRRGKYFQRPASGPIVLRFGRIGRGRYCDGINIKVREGDPIVAAENGIVAYRGNDIKSYGNMILIKHRGGYVTVYAHLKEIMVEKGQQVAYNQQIGKGGQTGFVSFPQLHFEIRKNGKPLNPEKII